MACPTVVQSETIISLKIKRITRLSSIAVEDSLFRYLRLCLLSMYVNAAKKVTGKLEAMSDEEFAQVALDAAE